MLDSVWGEIGNLSSGIDAGRNGKYGLRGMRMEISTGDESILDQTYACAHTGLNSFANSLVRYRYKFLPKAVRRPALSHRIEPRDIGRG